MQISLPSVLPAAGGTDTLFLFKPGDHIAARVIRRLGPFRFLVNFRGSSFAVNSSVALGTGDFILLELTDIKPRLKFRFLSVYQPERLATSAASFARLFRLDNHPLSALYVKWSLQLNLPVKQADLKKLKKVFSYATRAGKSPEELLLAFFSLEATARFCTDEERLVLLQWMFRKNFSKILKRDLHPAAGEKEIAPDIAARLENFFGYPDKYFFLKHLFFAGGKFPGQMKDFFTDLANASMSHAARLPADKELGQRISGKLHYRFFNAMVQWIANQVKRYENEQWVFLPFFHEQSGKNLFTFWRKKGSENSRRHEFKFVWNSRNFGDVSVAGSIRNGKIRIEIASNHQEFRILVDKQIYSLVERLENAHLNLIHCRIVRGRDFYSIVKKIFDNEVTAKFEVTV